jgi:pimeloyl-ACP methyl ester carboxylesterase
MKRLWFALILTSLSASPAWAAGSGSDATWRGTMLRGANSLPVEVVLSGRPGVRSTFTAGDLGAVDVPLAQVRLSDRIHFELTGDTSTTVFDGRLAGDTIEGTFADPAGPGTFRLHRAGSSARSYSKQEVTFANGAVRLAGSVLVPTAPGRHRAAVLVQGSGPAGRWAMLPLADALARHGIEALVFDKRGVGASGGDWRTATLFDVAGDVRAAVRLLAARRDVDRAAVGIYGHSQGAEIAPEVARDPRVRWIVAADGPVGPLYRQDLFRVRNILAKRYSGRDLADAVRVYGDFVNVARNGLPHDALRTEIARAHGAPWLALLAIPGDRDPGWRRYRNVANYDNRAAWSRVRVPVLLLFGGEDAIVPPRATIGTVGSILRAHGVRPTVVVLPGADHTLRVPPRGAGGWPRFAPGYPDVVVRWIERQPSTRQGR